MHNVSERLGPLQEYFWYQKNQRSYGTENRRVPIYRRDTKRAAMPVRFLLSEEHKKGGCHFHNRRKDERAMVELLFTIASIVVQVVAFAQACRILYVWHRRGLYHKLYARLVQLTMRLISRLKRAF